MSLTVFVWWNICQEHQGQGHMRSSASFILYSRENENVACKMWKEEEEEEEVLL